MAFDAILWAKLKSSASLVGGKVPSEQLPSYVDEVIEVTSYSNLPQPGVAGKIYYTLDKKESYRWGSSSYILVNSVNTDALAKYEDINNLQSHIESTYAKKTELVGLATEAFVDQKISDIKIPETDLSGYYKKTETYSSVEVDTKITKSLSGYASTQFVKDEISKIEIPKIDLSEYAKRSELPVIPTGLSAFTNDVGYLTEHQSLVGYATEQFVKNEISKIDVSNIDLSGYAKTSDLPTKTSQLTNDSGFLTQHQDLSLYAKKSEVKTDIESAVSGLATTSQINEINAKLELKSDEIPFKSDMIVGNSLGGFQIGENVKNMTLKSIIEKLLNLSASQDPEVPSNTITVENIKTSYISHDGGKTFEAITKDNVITDHGDTGIDQEGVFADDLGNVGYQLQVGAIDEDSIPAIYVTSSYKVTDIQKYDKGSHTWKSTSDKEAWIWDESPELKSVSINGETVDMLVYTYYFEAYDATGASKWRFIVEPAA